MRKRRIIQAGIAAAFSIHAVFASPASAQSAPETPAGEPEVDVHAQRDPALLPYRKGVDIIKRVQSAGGDHVRLLYRLTSKLDDKPIPDLRVTIEGSRVFGVLDIDADGFFTVPALDDAYQDNADFLTNQKRGSLKFRFVIEPVLNAQDLTLGALFDSVDGANRAVHEAVPWYFRLFLPTVRGVGICYSQPGHAVRVGDAHTARAADLPDADRVGHPLWCAPFGKADRNLPGATRLDPDDHWEPTYLVSYF
jgi:hypothetical protein